MCYRLAAFRSQCQWTRIFISLTTPMAMETQLGFKRHRESHSSQCSRKRWFQQYYQRIFLQVSLPLWMLEVHINGITSVTIHIESKIQKSWLGTNVDLLLFLHVTPFQPSPMLLLRVHLNGIGNVTIHLSVQKNDEFYTNVGRLRLF